MARLTITCSPRTYWRGEGGCQALQTSIANRLPSLQFPVQQLGVSEFQDATDHVRTLVSVIYTGLQPTMDDRQWAVEQFDQLLIQAGERAVEAVVEELVDRAVEAAILGAACGGGGVGLGTRKTEGGFWAAVAGAIAGTVVGSLLKRWVAVLSLHKEEDGPWIDASTVLGQSDSGLSA